MAMLLSFLGFLLPKYRRERRLLLSHHFSKLTAQLSPAKAQPKSSALQPRYPASFLSSSDGCLCLHGPLLAPRCMGFHNRRAACSSSALLSDRFHLLKVIRTACMYAKSLQSRLTLCNPMDCSPPGSTDCPGKNTGVGCRSLLQGTFPTQRSNLRRLSLLPRQAGSLPLAPPRKPHIRAAPGTNPPDSVHSGSRPTATSNALRNTAAHHSLSSNTALFWPPHSSLSPMTFNNYFLMFCLPFKIVNCMRAGTLS